MKILGILLVLGCTVGGLMMAAGVDSAIKLIVGVILPATPGEMVIIMGSALAAFLIANSMDVVKGAGSYLSLIHI